MPSGRYPADVFDRLTDRYDAGRPTYPGQVFDFIEEIGALRPGSRVLEVGPGTGQATEVLLRRGVKVHAVELGPALSHRLRHRLPSHDLHIVVGDIHKVALEAEGFDLAVAAMTFHWLDPVIALPRLAAALKPTGSLVVWWTVFGEPTADTPFRRRLRSIFDEFIPGERRDDVVPRPLRTGERVTELTQAGLFDEPRSKVIRWDYQMTADEARALFATFPNVMELESITRNAFLDAVAQAVEKEGDPITDPFVTAVYAVRKAAGENLVR